jgi:hypothetical protein
MAYMSLASTWLNVEYFHHKTDSHSSPIQDLIQDITQRIWLLIEEKPNLLSQLGSRAEALRYFFSRYLDMDADYLLRRLLDDKPDFSQEIQTFVAVPIRELFTPVATEVQRLDALCDCVQKLGMQGVMVWIDLPMLVDAEAEFAMTWLSLIFDSIEVMRKRNTHFKCLAIDPISKQLASMRGAATDSVDTYSLMWSQDELRQIVERRVSRAQSVGMNKPFDAFISVQRATEFLREYSDPNSPSEWLSLAHFVLERVKTTGHMPLDDVDWLTVCRDYHAARLKISMDRSGVFWRGPRPISDLTPRKRKIYSVIRYLYEHPGFHKTYLVAHATKINVEALNTNVHRGREFIEPRLDSVVEQLPIYLVTDPRGEGYALQHTDKWS